MSAFPYVPLGELMAKKAGSVDPAKFTEEVFDLYSIPAFDKGRPDIAVGSSIGSAKQVVRPKDILLSKIVPHIRRAWVVGAERGRRLIASGEWIVFRSEKIHPDYLRHFVISDPFHSQFMSTVSGVGGSLLRARPAQVANIEIPLPPLPEQRRIAAILDQADALRAKRREALAELDKLTQAIFVEMFGDPVVNPKGWPNATLGDLILSASDGPHVSPTYAETGIPFLSARHVRPNEISWHDMKYLSQADAEIQWKKCKPCRDDILYTKGGTTGFAAVVRTDEEFAVWVHVALLKPNKKIVEPTWLEAMLNSQYCYRQSQEFTHGIANRDLGLKRMIKIKMYHPPFEMQCEFTRRLVQLIEQKQIQSFALEKQDALFASLQHRAFRGEL